VIIFQYSPLFIKQKNVQALAAIENISLSEAKKRLSSNTPYNAPKQDRRLVM